MIQSVDQKDQKILSLLDFDARLPLSEIARQTSLSKQSVDYRLRSLIKRGVIEGFFPIINTPLLGYPYCRLSVQFRQLDPQTKQTFLAYVFGHKKLFWAFELGGEFDFLLVFWPETISDFTEIVADFKTRFGNVVIRTSEQIVTNVIHLSHKIFKPVHPRRFDLMETPDRFRLDEADKAVLRELSLDARASSVTIAQKTNLAPKTVSYRIKKMENARFIAGYRPILNYEKLGLTYYKVFLNLSAKKLSDVKKFEQFLVGHPMVLFVVEGVSMPGDVDFELLAESNQAFFDFIASAKNAFPGLVADYKYLIFTKTVKVNYLPFI